MEYLARIWTKRSMTVMLLAKLDGDSCNSRSSTRSQGLTSYKPLGITLLMTLWPSRESLMCQTIKSKQTPWTCQVLLPSLRDSSTTESMTSKCSTTWGTRTIPWLWSKGILKEITSHMTISWVWKAKDWLKSSQTKGSLDERCDLLLIKSDDCSAMLNQSKALLISQTKLKFKQK